MATKKLTKNFKGNVIEINQNPFEYLDSLESEIKVLYDECQGNPDDTACYDKLVKLCAEFTTVQDAVIKAFKKGFDASIISADILSKDEALSKLESTQLHFSDDSAVGFDTSDVLEVDKAAIMSMNLSENGKFIDNQTAYCRYKVKESAAVSSLNVTDANGNLITSLDGLCKHLIDVAGLPQYFSLEPMYKFKPALAKEGDKFVKVTKELNKYFE